MKKLIYIFLAIIYSGNAFGQTGDHETMEAELSEAYTYVIGFKKPYVPERAYKVFKKYAQQGVPKAMNALGMLYRTGAGVSINYSEAAKWYRLAGENGYPQGWYNLGMMYKYAYGFEQNFDSAFQCFQKAEEMGFANGMYAAGYMLYKGLGSRQDYQKAFALFKKAAELGHPASMYMLGICYRNGYGISKSEGTGIKWLTKSDSLGYYSAKLELKNDKPENQSKNIAKKGLRTSSKFEYDSTEIFKFVEHNISQQKISGEYVGYIATYDWSGQHIISQEPLRLKITGQGNILVADWLQNDSLSAQLQAVLSDTCLKFTKAQYKQADRYHSKPVLYHFKKASLNIVEDEGKVHLTGNLQLFSPETYEPERPVYISLTRKDGTVPSFDNAVAVFPNPFQHGINFRFNLAQDSKVNVAVFTLAGTKVFQGSYETLPAGENLQYLPLDLPRGVYVFKLAQEGRSTSTIIVKE